MPRIKADRPRSAAPTSQAPKTSPKKAAAAADPPPKAGWSPSSAARGPRTAAAARVDATQFTDPKDWHPPTLREVFDLAAKFPGKPIFLDTKLPNDPAVARRMAQQYMEVFREYPSMRDRAFIGNANAAMLDVMKAEFAKTPGFENFKGFAYDHEDLSDFKLGHKVSDAAPLKGAGDNRWLSMGAPYKPFSVGEWSDVLELTRKTLAETRNPSSPHFGKQLCVWTIDDEKQMRDLAAIGPDAILTDNPTLLNKVLDERYGPAGVDPKRPKVMCHRGGPDGSGAPENTLPMIERGLRMGDAIEIDVCSAKDGQVVMHDNDPKELIPTLRRSGGGVGEFRPVYEKKGPNVSLKRMDELTLAQIQEHYRYAKDEKGLGANVKTGVETAGRLARNIVR